MKRSAGQPSKLTLLRRLLRVAATKRRKAQAVTARMRPFVQREEAEWERFLSQYERGEL